MHVCVVFWPTWSQGIFVRQSKQGSEATSLHCRGTTCFKIRSKVCKTLQNVVLCGWCDHTRSGWMNDGRRKSNRRNRRTPLILMHSTTELWLFKIGSDIKPITAQWSNLGICWYQVHWPGSSRPGNYPSQHGTTGIKEVCVLKTPVDSVQYVWIAGEPEDKRLVKTPLILRGWIYERTKEIKPAQPENPANSDAFHNWSVAGWY